MRLALVLACALLVLPGSAAAAILIEATRAGEPIRLVIDRLAMRVLVEKDTRPWLVDLAAGVVYPPGDQAEPIHARFRPGVSDLPPYRLERFGPGPIQVGHPTVYHVLFVQDEVCAEVLSTPWTIPFIDPAVQALTLVDRIGGERIPTSAEACPRIPFTTLAADGWPMLAGKLDQPIFKTRTFRMDYRPAPGELEVPARFQPPAPAAGG